MAGIIYLISKTIDKKILANSRAIIANFFSGVEVKLDQAAEKQFVKEQENFTLSEKIISIEAEKREGAFFYLATDLILKQHGKILFKKKIEQKLNTEEALPVKEPLLQLVIKKAIYLFLKDYTGRNNPWGILSGIRPGKLITLLSEQGYNREEQERVLNNYYLVSSDKVKLLQQVHKVQEPYSRLMKNSDRVAIYLSIPFCPTRCFYCSFPSYPLTARNKELVFAYLDALKIEIKLVGEMLWKAGLKAESIYLGGGTPTVLTASQLDNLLQVVNSNLPFDERTEFTVEAGRPDTIDLEKLKLLEQTGVNRLSINPQTMQEKTLKRIGRTHSITAILEAYELAKTVSDWVINMDIIIGLPGEGQAEIIDTLEKILELKPSNLTVHALALKRGSAFWENSYWHYLDQNGEEIGEEIKQCVFTAGYQPYYLYRQKNIVGNMENIGYALPGKICRYNIAIIEEIQNVIGIGLNATSKILTTDRGHQNIYHAQDLKRYFESFTTVQEKRKAALETYLGLERQK
ncbi:MAG: coproporphyrinogen dehydrogenase HemZ [Desulfitobacteriia bacterium]|jgi:oxygen-independent coproporphyrinogen-3 oxidase